MGYYIEYNIKMTRWIPFKNHRLIKINFYCIIIILIKHMRKRNNLKLSNIFYIAL